MKLIIVESPSKSKTIEKYLGKDYKVMASVGHIRDLTKTGKGGLGVDVENNFQAKYTISKEKREIVKELKEKVKKAELVLLATDPDREGEAISWHLFEVLDLKNKKTSRVEFHEITKNAVLKAIENPRNINIDLVKSQETRRIEDRIIGFKLSKILQKKIRSKSAGRVQSIALRLICDKEEEIKSFIPEEYWDIDLLLEKNNQELKVSLFKINNEKAKITNQEEANAVKENTKSPIILTNIIVAENKRQAYAPFTTSTLQQTASTKLSMSSRKTMVVAQELYEGVKLNDQTTGLITYMRTDSTRFSNEFVSQAKEYIEKNYGKEYIGNNHYKNKANSQDAHEGIRPTSLANSPELIKPYLTIDQYKLYRLIYVRALASLMSNCVNETTTYEFKQNQYLYHTSGSVEKFDGFLKVYRHFDNSKEVVLPKFNINDVFNIKDILCGQHFTKAPDRYTEASLIKALEENGVGRPSTYASTIDTIQKRSYVELKKNSDTSKSKHFIPTEQGILTDQTLKDYFLPIINVEYTANLEKQLDDIAFNKLDNITVLKDFYEKLTPLIDNALSKMPEKEFEKTGDMCPVCNKELVYRDSRFGKFISCIDYPNCKYVKNEETGIKCPDCGKDVIIRTGRFGKFYACVDYPSCKYHKGLNDDNKEKPEILDRNCPKCDKTLLKRKSKYGTYFIACSGFPKCRYVESLDKKEKKAG